MVTMVQITAYILAKNEEANIGKCLRLLSENGFSTVVLDSGSTDRTERIVNGFPQAVFEPFEYVNHMVAYNEITGARTTVDSWVLILDADMEITSSLAAEIRKIAAGDSCDVVLAPITMCVDGCYLRHGSLCPDKPVAFRGGGKYFVARGHGEALKPQVSIKTVRSELLHNDLKDYTAYLESQVRYGRNLLKRCRDGKYNWKDWLRVRTPLAGFISGFVSYIFHTGFMSDR